jgi:hypothetical protein
MQTMLFQPGVLLCHCFKERSCPKVAVSRIDLISPDGIGHVGSQFGGSDPATAIGHVHYGVVIRAQCQSDIPRHRAAGTNSRPVAVTRQDLAPQPLALMIRGQRRTEAPT